MDCDRGRGEFLAPGNQEITRSTGTRKKIRNQPGNHQVSAEMWVFLGLCCSGEAKEKKKKEKKSFPVFFGNPSKKSRFCLVKIKMASCYQEFTRGTTCF
jgi:hypothetical protein